MTSIEQTTTDHGPLVADLRQSWRQGTTKSTSFSWTVVGRPTITTPNPGTDTIGAAISVSMRCTSAGPLSTDMIVVAR